MIEYITSVELDYLVFTSTPGNNYGVQFKRLLLCPLLDFCHPPNTFPFCLLILRQRARFHRGGEEPRLRQLRPHKLRSGVYWCGIYNVFSSLFFSVVTTVSLIHFVSLSLVIVVCVYVNILVARVFLRCI